MLIAQIARVDLDVERSSLYCCLILNSLPEIARRALLAMDIKNMAYQYQSEFARRFYGQGVEAGIARGIAQGKEQGRIDMLLQLLKTRYGDLSTAAANIVWKASAAEVDKIAERVLTAKTLNDALGLR